KIQFWQIGKEAEIHGEDFFDHTHLASDPARERFTTLLAAKISFLMKSAASGHEAEAKP
ncbi:MAG: hypothetical protein JNL58_32170, partial [Planctomyces sp.]|nr:hypothetical protein [Planctomyces sp.]